MMQYEIKKAIGDEFDTESDENTVESLKDKLYKGVIEQINESDRTLPREGNQTSGSILLGYIYAYVCIYIFFFLHTLYRRTILNKMSQGLYLVFYI